MRVLVAPDKFKNTLPAPAVAECLQAGIRAAHPDAVCELCPLADGGDGTGEVLSLPLRADRHTSFVLGPRGDPVPSAWWASRSGRVGIVEMAQASGLALLPRTLRDPLRTTSYGTGQVLRFLAQAGCRQIVLGVGGSATVDGGAGCLQALGWGLLGRGGTLIRNPASGGDLRRITGLRPPRTRWRPTLRILCDVDNPLLGRTGAARMFGPQKGASRAAVHELERGLENWAGVLEREFGLDVRMLPGAGAAGGLPAGLAAALGACLCSGFDEIARLVKLRERLSRCDVCVTGEGRLDEQTLRGKVVAGVARLAAEAGVPALALVGALRLGRGQTAAELQSALGLHELIVISPAKQQRALALRATAVNLRAAAEEWAARWRPTRRALRRRAVP